VSVIRNASGFVCAIEVELMRLRGQVAAGG